MKKIDVGHVIQISANVGVVASIILLAFQLQQNNKILAASNAAVRVTESTSIWDTVIEQPEIAELLVRDRQGEGLTPAQEMRLDAFWIRGLYDMQYVFQTAPGDQLWVKGLRRAFQRYGSLGRTWNGGGNGSVIAQKDLFTSEFVEFLDAKVFKEATAVSVPASKGASVPASKIPTP